MSLQNAELTIDRSIPRALRAFDSDRLRWLDEAAALGPLTALRFGRVRTWVLSDPDLVRQMLIGDAASWERPPAAVIPIRLGVGENLFTMPDDAWETLQPQVAPAFRKRALDERLSNMTPIIESSIAALGHDRTFDAELMMGALALRLAAWVMFGEQLEHDRAVVLAGHQRAVVTWVGKRLGQLRGLLPFTVGAAAREMRGHRRVLEEYSDEVLHRVDTRAYDISRGDETDVGALLVRAKDRSNPLSAGSRRSHVLGLLLAGNETTAAALSWALYNGARHPTEWASLGEAPSAVRPFLDETLRLTPAVWGFARRPTTRNAAVGGQPIGRSEVVTIYLRGMNRDPQRWPDPTAFLPERHLDGSALDATMLSFGLGPRGCIGQHFAMAEMLAVLPMLARAGDVSSDTATVQEDASFALRVKGGLRVRLHPRI
jgi:cytochrome P450